VNSYYLNIAGYKIRFERDQSGPDLVPSERFAAFICDEDQHYVLIRVHSGSFSLPAGTRMVFNAPYVEEINGIPVLKRDEFWSIHKNGQELFIVTLFPLSGFRKKAVLRFSLLLMEWDLWIDGPETYADPMEYPLDGLILYYLTVLSGDIMIHASGVNHAGNGYIFSGVSGKGKSTMARLWDQSGAKVIHDDRLIIRSIDGKHRFFNTPVYNNDLPSESSLDKIFLISHFTANITKPVLGASAISLVMANCIQHNWDTGIVDSLIGSVLELCTAIPVVQLGFLPDKSVIDHILSNE
jgi:hypothetical protein